MGTPQPTIDDLILDEYLSTRIFYHLEPEDLLNCRSVNKVWNRALRDIMTRNFEIDCDFLSELRKSNKTTSQYFSNKVFHVLEINGWALKNNEFVKPSVYDELFTSSLKATKLILRGRGYWNNCCCPKVGSTCGEQFDTVQSKDLTNFEYIHIVSTFCISVCNLLDLVSRSPKLKELRYYGHFEKSTLGHYQSFASKRFYCDLDRLYWPWVVEEDSPILKLLVKRNENISTLYTNGRMTCDLLAADALPNLRFLSLCLNEDWHCRPNKFKKAYKLLNLIKYLSSAKNVEALEVRSFPLEEIKEEKTRIEVDRIYENFRLQFWEQVAQFSKLRFLAIYGAWDFSEVCRELAKHKLQIQYLKINLMPNSLIETIDNGSEQVILSVADGLRNLRKLLQLRSLHFICGEKLLSIDKESVAAFKELVDLIWNLDIKICCTGETEDLLSLLSRRANQLGKIFKTNLNVQHSDEYADLLIEHTLKFSPGTNVREALRAVVSEKLKEKLGIEFKGMNDLKQDENFTIWGIRQTGSRDSTSYEKIHSDWQFYEQIFHHSLSII